MNEELSQRKILFLIYLVFVILGVVMIIEGFFVRDTILTYEPYVSERGRIYYWLGLVLGALGAVVIMFPILIEFYYRRERGRKLGKPWWEW
jgi:drug/metabolite transporter (DMT)-like permease